MPEVEGPVVGLRCEPTQRQPSSATPDSLTPDLGPLPVLPTCSAPRHRKARAPHSRRIGRRRGIPHDHAAHCQATTHRTGGRPTPLSPWDPTVYGSTMQAVRTDAFWHRPVVWVRVLVLFGGAAGGTTAQVAPHPYRATSRLYVATSSSADVRSLQQAQHFVQQAAESYANVATTPLVLGRVTSQLHLKTAPTDLRDHVSAHVVPDMAVIEITASDASATRSARIANAVSAALIFESRALAPSGVSSTPVRLTAIQPARPSTATREIDLLAFVGLGAAGGLLASLLILLIRSGRPKPPRGTWRLVWIPRPPAETA
jgi:capsular polysaccharide biosynthesis protein